ncbi:MAG: hypothetical protein ACI8TX_002249 [Hyphomicrobiaceae bacterium]
MKRLAARGEFADYALCLDAADIEVESEFGVAESRASKDGYVCHGDPTGLDLLAADHTFLNFVDAAVLAANPVPNKCVKKAVVAAAKGATKSLTCYRKAARRWDPAKLATCKIKANRVFFNKWRKVKKPVECAVEDYFVA